MSVPATSPILGIFGGRPRHYCRPVRTWESARARVERACEAGAESKQLRLDVLAALRSVVPFDAHVWLLTDPVTQVGTSPLAEIPGLAWADLPDLILRRYLAGEAWADFRPPGASDLATSIYADRFGCWGWLDLWRTSGTFTIDERRFLVSVQTAVTAALRRAQARTFLAQQPDPESADAAVLLLRPDLRPSGQTSAAARTLTQLNPPGEDVPVIPAAAYNVAAALLAAEAGKWVGAAWSRVHLGGSRWVTLSAARIDNAGTIAVTIATSTPAQRREIFALAHALSARERQVLEELATGVDTPTIARHLVLSEHTVNDHVKAVLSKTGLATRAQLLARVAG